MTELLTLPSPPGSPEGWPGPECARGTDHGGSNPDCSSEAPKPHPPVPRLVPGCGWGPGCARGPPFVSSGSRSLWKSPGGDSCGLRPRRGCAGQGGSLGCRGPPRAGHYHAPRGWGIHSSLFLCPILSLSPLLFPLSLNFLIFSDLHLSLALKLDE